MNPHAEHAPGTFDITVNSRPRQVSDHRLGYEQVVRLAFPDDTPSPDIVYTVTYSHPHGHDGSLASGQQVTVKDGMNFHVRKTNRS